ncbi:MAG: alpha/beta fold hydrolase [Planctomycetota bacterium]
MTPPGGTAKRPRPVLSWLRRWGWALYLLLLAASALWQAVDFRAALAAEREAASAVETARYARTGPVDGPRVRLQFTDSAPGDLDRPALLLIHGSPGRKDNFDLLVPRLAEHYRVLTVDLPGFGGSSRWVPSYSTRAHARYLLDLLDQLGLDSAHVLGFSMGSGVALELHDLAPGRLESVIFYGGIGIQEGEGTGDYTFEHFKYTVGYAALVVFPELVPHFGLLGPRATRHAFIRNFHDTDQRPMRRYLQELDAAGTPLLLLHGRHDPLVPATTAQAHHDLVERSELVMFNRSHFMVFDESGARLLADEIVPFVDRFARADPPPPVRRSLYHPGAEQPAPSMLPVDLNIPRGTNPWLAAATIIGATYVLEDPTTIAVGLLVRDGQLDPFLAVFAVFLGIFSGDIGLYLIGWVFGRRALAWKPVAKRLPVRQVEKLGQWFDRHGWTAVLASRFVPGTRLPLYVSAGALGKKPGRFALWTLLAVAIWAPVMLLIVVLLGEAAASPFTLLFGRSWLALIAAIALLLVFVRVLMHLPTARGRQKLWVKISRLWRWEFWPMAVFYAPLVPWLAYLGLRYRSATVWTLANPGLPDGGVVGESKTDIIAALATDADGRPDDTHVLPAHLVDDAAHARQTLADHGWALPVILKPNAAQRGAGVRLIHHDHELEPYFRDSPGPALLQKYHAGPYEAGVFYVRHPDEPHGRIFSITDKDFPALTGDGRTTLEDLIWKHPRYRMQAGVFLKRFPDADVRVPGDGQTLRLAMAGNHCQGTRFADGGHLITPELEAAVDRVLQRLDGFYFGRLDARYADPDAFKAGRDFAILELNGVTSESTNLYDPAWPLTRAYRTLFKQWSLCFAIGHANRKKHHLTPPGPLTLWRRTRAYYKHRRINPLAD